MVTTMRKYKNIKDFRIHINGKERFPNEEFYVDETEQEIKNATREKYIERLT